MKDEIDTALNDYFESLKPSPEEVQKMLNDFPELKPGYDPLEHALDMFADFIDRTDPEKN